MSRGSMNSVEELARREVLCVEFDADRLVFRHQAMNVEVRTRQLDRSWLTTDDGWDFVQELCAPIISELTLPGQANRWLIVSRSLKDGELEAVFIAIQSLLSDYGIRAESCRHDQLARALQNAKSSAEVCVISGSSGNVAFVIESCSLLDEQLHDASLIEDRVTFAGLPLVKSGERIPDDCEIVIVIGEQSTAWFESLRHRIAAGEFRFKHVALLACTNTNTFLRIADEILDGGAVAAIQHRMTPRFGAFVPLVEQMLCVINEADESDHVNGDLLVENAIERCIKIGEAARVEHERQRMEEFRRD